MMSEEYAVLTAAERGRHDADGVEASSIEVVEVVTNDANNESEGVEAMSSHLLGSTSFSADS